jgi:hypothetical protein
VPGTTVKKNNNQTAQTGKGSIFQHFTIPISAIAYNRKAAWRQAGLHTLSNGATNVQKYTNLSNGGTPRLRQTGQNH